MNFLNNYPFEFLKLTNFDYLAKFSVITYFHYFGIFGIILSKKIYGGNFALLGILVFEVLPFLPHAQFSIIIDKKN